METVGSVGPAPRSSEVTRRDAQVHLLGQQSPGRCRRGHQGTSREVGLGQALSGGGPEKALEGGVWAWARADEGPEEGSSV